MKFRLSPIAMAILAVHALPVAAQQTEAAPTEVAPADVTQLKEVRVRADAPSEYKQDQASSTKFTAPLRDTPKSVTVIPAQVLRDTASTSLQDALRTVPGITFLAGEGGQALADRPVIRGLNSTSSMFVDGIRDIGTQTRDVFDLEAVEVIKGADSAFGGRSSGGGSINLVSKQAKAEEIFNASLMLGTDSTVRGTVDRNWKIGEQSAFRLNVLGNSGGTPGRDDAVDYERWGIAGALAFGLGTSTRITVDYYHLTDEGMPDYSMPYDRATGLPVTETRGVSRDAFYGLTNRDFRNAETDIGTLTFERDLEHGLLLRNATRIGRSLNDYVVTNPDDSAGNVDNGTVYRSTKNRWAQTDTFANVTDLSGKVKTAFIEHSFNVGAEFSREKKEQDGYTITATNPHVNATTGATTRICTDPLKTPAQASYDCTNLYNPNPNDPWAGTVQRNFASTNYQTDIVGVYAFDTLSFNEQWQLNLGLRWDSYETSTSRTSGTAPISASQKDDFLNYQAGLVFKPVEAGSIYLSYATATTPAPLGSGDEDGATATNQDFDPEESGTVELGTKWAVFDDSLLLTFAVFETERKNAYLAVSATTTEKVGKTRVRGAEFSFAGNITEDWALFGGYSYLDSELVRGAYNSLGVGKQLPNTAENTFSLFTTYQVVPKIKVGGGAYYVSKVYGTWGTTATPATGTVRERYVPDYWRFDANASYQVSSNFDVQLNVQNLTDEVYYTKAYASHYAALGTGRQFLLSLNMNF